MRFEQFSDKHRNLNLERKELERKWRLKLEEEMLLEAISQKSKGSTNAPGVGGGGGGGSFTNFAALFSRYEGTETYPQSAISDDAGNIFTLSRGYGDDDPLIFLRKITSAGVIVWEILLGVSDTDSDISTRRIRLSPDGDLYVIVKAGIAKFSTSDGAVQWNYLVNNSLTLTTMVSLAFLSDGTPVTLSNYFDGGVAVPSLLCTWNKTTGAKLTEKQFDLGLSDQYVNADIVIDEDDNVVMALAYSADDIYGTVIIKWNLADDVEVWKFDINSVDYDDNDQDVTGLGIDQEGNIYANGYGNALTKLNSDGELVWAIVEENSFLPGLAVSPVGDCYMFGEEIDELQVTKISSDGDLQWSYRVSAEDDLDDAGWDNDAMSAAQWSNDKMYLMASYDNPIDGDHELILKVGDQQISGVYGPFTFTQYTETITTVEPTDAGHTAATSDTDILIDSVVTLEIIAASPPALQTVEITNLQ